MGWFLTGKGNAGRKPSKAKRSTSVDRKPWDPRRTLIGLKFLSVFVASIVFVTCWWHAQRHLVNYLGSHPEHAARNLQVEMVNMPSWMNPQVHDDLRLLAARQVGRNPFNVHSLRSVHDALSQNAWVDRVERVERISADHVRVHATYRQPVAFIERGSECYLIDHQGIRLPGVYRIQQATQLPLPILRGVDSPVVLEGKAWTGPAVQAGLSLVRELAREPYSHQVETIDVSGRDSRGRIHLAIMTGRGGVVRWGLPPGQEQSVEPPASTKRAWLAQLVRENGSIDAGGKMVDLYRAAVFVHLPPGREIGQREGYTYRQ
jgi:hypothetical protein